MNKFLQVCFLILLTGFFSEWFLLDTEAAPKEFPSLYVNYETKGNQILVECIVGGISFREPEHPGQKTGKIIIWVDGQRRSEEAQAAFIIKGLSPGSHKIRIEVVSLKNEPYGLKKEFLVNIPK
ncbi:hypothetical protein [Neobacillus niacini]|uniref:hypothetical protein n=1 Tax=Neobacillus niacini TaxID=86668 RepID=UPI0021CB2D33|nr:hypothetical protein [Neobacillus niacini]MCM3768561.1 hypothetical protein [Neobacillus niacini]